jgi:DNA polymerase-3 subunit epsilon
MTQSWQASFDDIGRPLSATTFVVVDLETTGGSPADSEITEIGAVKVRGGRLLGEYKTFVNPGLPIPAFITVLTGITDAMVVDAPVIAELLPGFLQFPGPASETVFVAHNAQFDLGFLKAAAKKHGYSWPKYPVLDTVRIARQVMTKEEVPNNKLGSLAAFFGAQTTPNHRALDDARATVDVLHGLFDRLGSFGITTLEELLSFCKQVSSAQHEKRHLAANIPACAGVYIFRNSKTEERSTLAHLKICAPV